MIKTYHIIVDSNDHQAPEISGHNDNKTLKAAISFVKPYAKKGKHVQIIFGNECAWDSKIVNIPAPKI